MNGSIHVLSFDRESELLERFLALPARIYAQDPLGPPASAETERRAFAADHLFYAYGCERRFLACRGARDVARCAAVWNGRLMEREPGVGLIGFFEAENDPEACGAMLKAASDWLAARDCRRVRAPVDRDTWHRYRVRLPGGDPDPIAMEPRNPDYYAELFRRAGFSREMAYVTTEVADTLRMASHYAPFVERCRRRGTILRGLDLNRYEEEVALLHRISLEIFEENYGYSPIGPDEFLSLYRSARNWADPDFIRLAFDAAGQPIGYVFAFLDPRPGHSPRGQALNIKTLGVVPRRRAHGVGPALVGEVYHAAVVRGIARVRHCLMKTDNTSARYGEDLGRVVREYRLFERNL